MGSMKTCQEITLDIERGKYVKLSIKDKLAVKMHLLICKPCQNFSKDSKIIDDLLKKKFSDLSKFEFSEEEKAAMISKLGK